MDRKLLIIGAGGHGQVVAEVAEDCGYVETAFLDDNSNRAIGKIDDLEKFKLKYSEVFVGIGDNKKREKLLTKIKKLGFNIPILVHPTAYISKSCKIENGTIIEPKVIVNANSVIGEGSIISVGAIVDHDVVIGKFCHINSGAIVKAGAEVVSYEKLEAGKVVLGYESAIVKQQK